MFGVLASNFSVAGLLIQAAVGGVLNSLAPG
jgi:hypothetical protein